MCKKLLNVREVSNLLKVHENTVRDWSNRGIIRSSTIPGTKIKRFYAKEINGMREEMWNEN